MVAAVFVIMVFVLIRRTTAGRGAPSKDFTVRLRRFLSAREMEAFRILAPIAESLGLHACPQASMDSFLTFEGEGGFRERGRYKARRSDFALMDNGGSIVLIVEIDDASHRGNEEKDAARDEVVGMAGVSTLRIPAGRLPGSSDMRRLVERSLREGRGR
jgi:hypothetical protein